MTTPLEIARNIIEESRANIARIDSVFEKLELSQAKHVEYYNDMLFGLSALLDEITNTLV